MLRVVVESAKSLPKKTVGSPDPVVSVIFKAGLLKMLRVVVESAKSLPKKTVGSPDPVGTPLDSSSYVDVVVKDYETLGKDKYVGRDQRACRP
ncbi:hypothetical protein CRUP_007370 [Coryphaenoides rupestris]|nr:hypothetical protein CRUP_007370 [Coryphaenoides rupestris]